jgi:hypothetical protein
MGKKLHWVREAFSRTIVIRDGEKEVGKMARQSVFSNDMEAALNQSHFIFDVKGFILHTVDIIDLNQNNKIVGVITFSFGRKAELALVSGEHYLWRRRNFLMRNWTLIKEGSTSSAEIVHYERVKRFFAEEGDVDSILPGVNSDLLILAGLFIGGYFLRRKRMAAAAH